MADEALSKVMERLEELSNQMNEIKNATEAGQNTQNLIKRQTPAEIIKGSEIPDSQEFHLQTAREQRTIQVLADHS